MLGRPMSTRVATPPGLVAAHRAASGPEYTYRPAVLAKAATGRRHRGRSALRARALALGIARPTLQAYVSLVARWSAADIKRLLGRRDCRGRPVITVSQLVLIARAPASHRADLVERASRGDLDIRDLRSLLRKRIDNDSSIAAGSTLHDILDPLKSP
jgi:hypothetical protein